MISDQYALFFCIHPYLLQFFKTSSTNTCYMYVCHGLFCLFISRSSVRLRVMNNPGLLTDNAASINLMTNLPSNSPAAKKTKPNSPQTNQQPPITVAPLATTKHRSKKRSPSPAKRPPSSIKLGKFSSWPSPVPKEPSPPPQHDHNHKNVLIDISIDFNKDCLTQFEGDNGKKVVYAIQQLILNLKIADKMAVLNLMDDSQEDPLIGGASPNNVPQNMTALRNYVTGLNPCSFQTTSRPLDRPEMGAASSRWPSPSVAYGVISISCDKDPETLINQLSYEWARFGSYLKIKELQAVETITPFQIYFVYSLTHCQTLIDEQREILRIAQDKMHQEDYFVTRDLPRRWGYCFLLLCSLRMNVPRIPKHSEPVIMLKLPASIQTCRKVLHLEVDKRQLDFITHLVQYAKKAGIYAQWWGPHAHPTEGVDWNSLPGDIKRAAKFAVKTTNYNASMTSTNVHGFLDLNDIIHVCKPNGSVVKLLTGRECLTSLFKFKDSSSLIAEVHQQVPLGPVSLVYPNTPEGEKLMTSLAKQLAAFAIGYLGDQKIDQTFINNFLKTYINPQLIHEAPQCEWDPDPPRTIRVSRRLCYRCIRRTGMVERCGPPIWDWATAVKQEVICGTKCPIWPWWSSISTNYAQGTWHNKCW